MSGKSGKGRRSTGGRSGKGSTTPQTKKAQGQCSALGNHVFDYGTTEAPDQTRTSWEAFVLHAAAKYGQDIGGELRNRKTLNIPRPEYSDEALTAHAAATTRRDTLVAQLKTIKETKLAKLEALAAGGDDDAKIATLELLAYEMAEDATAAETPLPITS